MAAEQLCNSGNVRTLANREGFLSLASHLEGGSLTLEIQKVCMSGSLTNDSHVLIHGHNMGNGTMFRNLNLFKNRQFMIEHPAFYLYTPDEVYTVEIFAGSIVRIDSPLWQLDFTGREDINSKICIESF